MSQKNVLMKSDKHTSDSVPHMHRNKSYAVKVTPGSGYLKGKGSIEPSQRRAQYFLGH